MNLRKSLTVIVAIIGLNPLLTAQITLTVDHPNQDNDPGTVDNTAIEEVNLLPGYSYVGDSERKMNAYLDPTIIAPSNYGNLFSQEDFDNYTINTDLEVGFTPGAHGVSPSGAATYTVPIQLPPGTNGMEPSLSITYNSQAGNGLLGMGWNLAGLSVISRVGKTIYHDGISDKIRFDSSDRFALDGNRLVSTIANEFATEQETFSLITSHGSAGNGPAWFEVRTKDGMTMEYGKTDDSRLIATENGEALNWMLNKVYDQHGNYIEYTYFQENNQVRIDKIKYTGNEAANLEPYNEVQFYYQDREDISEGYVGGSYMLSTNQLLKAIGVRSSSAHYRKYEFEYGFNDLNSFLTSISESGFNSKFNKTIFEYEESSFDNYLTWQMDSPKDNNQGCDLNGSVKYYPGDFNGDGVTDFLGVFYDKEYVGNTTYAKYNSWAIFINGTATGDGWTCSELSFPEEWVGRNGYYSKFDQASYFPIVAITFRIGDLTGNGIDDIVVGTKPFNPFVEDEDSGLPVYYNAFLVSNDEGNISIEQANETLYFDDNEGNCFLCPNPQNRHAVALGDFDGDGILEFLGVNTRNMDFKIRSFDGRVILDIAAQITHDRIHTPRALAGDYDGDGKSDIVLNYSVSSGVLNDNFTDVTHVFDLNFDAPNHLISIEQSSQEFSLFKPNRQISTEASVDFNGDGINDLVRSYESGIWASAQILFGTGNDLLDFSNSFSTEAAPPNLVSPNVFYADVNGDGRTDVIEVFGSTFPANTTNNGMPLINIHLSTGRMAYCCAFHSYTRWGAFGFNENNQFDFIDMDGDGNLEMVVTSGNDGGNIYVHKLNSKSSTNDRRLKRLKNGFGQIIEFRYQTVANTANGSLHGDQLAFPLRKFFGSFPIVQWVLTKNQLGNTVSELYKFNGAIAHLQGKGFLGFENMNIEFSNPASMAAGSGEPPGENFTERNRTFMEYELNDEYYFLNLANTKQFAGSTGEELNNIASETSFKYSIAVDTDHDTYWVKHEETNSYNHISNVQSVQTFEYDNDGNLTRKEIVVGENGTTEITTTDYSNFFTLNNGNWHIASSLPETVITSTSRNSEVELTDIAHLAYNPNGTIQSKNQNLGTDAWSYQEYEYNNNPFGLIDKVTISGYQPTQGGVNSDGVITTNEQITPIITDQYTYTPNGRNVLTHTDRFGFETEYTYYNRWGTPKTVTNHLGQQTYMEYDGFGRLKKEVDHLGNVTTVERQFYDGFTDQFTDCQSASDVLYQKTITLSGSDAVRTSTEWFNKFGQVRLHDATARSGIVRTTTCYDKRGRSFKTTTPHFIGEADFKEVVTEYDKYDRVKSRSSDPVQMDLDYEIVLTGGTESVMTSNAMDTRRTETDATGRVVKRKDSGNANTLDYIYQSGGLLKTVKLNNSIVAENTYDAFGRQIALSDPMASGTTLYQYDAFDRLVFQKDNKGNKIETYFDDYGRIEKRDVTGITPSYEDDYIYEYYNSGHQNTLLKKETAPGDNATEYTYNENGSITSITETIDEVDYTTQWQFDEYQKPTRKEYPSGFAIRYHYDNGYLQRITTDAGATIWEIGNDGVNARGQIMGYSLGNGVSVSHTYDDDFLPESVIAENDEEELFTFTYYFKPESGNLRNRNLHGMTEWFEYDNGTSIKLQRLTGAGLSQNSVDVSYLYSPNGNMVSKSDVGQYTYDSDQEYQVSQIDFEGGVDPEDPLIDMVGHQAVVYNHFNSASLIHDLTSDRKVELFYGPDDQRRMAVYKEEDDEVKTRYYVGAYEKQIDHQNQNNEIRVHYISAMGQLVAIYVEDDSQTETDDGLNGKMYYPHLDHLGSIIYISDASGDIVYTQSFDAWGRTRNPDDLTYDNIPARPDWLWRGYTGHEHLDEFGLINMNGRLYDPVVGRMLSPDNYVQSPDFSQSYNRYSYVWNNPLKYTDPSGEIVFIVPHIGVSSSGSLDIGVSVGVGFKGGLSAQVTVGHSFGNGGNTYATLSASVAGASAYVGYSSQGGAMAGVGFGIGPGLGGFTTNATSAGIHWSQKGGFTANASIFSYNQHGGFNAHLTAGYSQGLEVGMRKVNKWSTNDNFDHSTQDNNLTACTECVGTDPPKNQEITVNIREFEFIERLEVYFESIGAGGPIVPGIWSSSWRNIGYHARRWDSSLNGSFNGGKAPKLVRAGLEIFPPFAVVDAAKTTFTGEDIHGRQVSPIDRALAPLGLAGPLFKSAGFLKTTESLIIDRTLQGRKIYNEITH